jgi:hypothetical protein
MLPLPLLSPPHQLPLGALRRGVILSVIHSRLPPGRLLFLMSLGGWVTILLGVPLSCRLLSLLEPILMRRL